SVDWGAWSEVGMAARGTTIARAGAQGMAPLTPAEGLQALGVLLRDAATQAAVAPIDWATLAAQLGPQVPPFLADLVAQEKNRGARGAQQAAEARVDYAALEPKARGVELVTLVQREVA